MIKEVVISLFLAMIILSLINFNRINYKITEGTEVSSRIIKKINGDYKFSSLGKEWNPTDELWKDKNSEDYSEFWKENKKKIRQFLEENEIKENKDFNNKAVIHFRCSDVPFNKDENYNLLPKEYFYFALEKIEMEQLDEIVFVNCTDWKHSLLSNRCDDFIETIEGWLREKTDIKIRKEKICTDVKKTYEIFLGARILVSTGGGFPFIPGILKDKGFISPSNIGEGNKELFLKYKDLHEKVHWTMWDKFDRISHNMIDYNTFVYKFYEINSNFKVNLD